MQRLSYSHVVVSCRRFLEFEPDDKGGFLTTCPSVYECYGCNGEFYVPPPDPRTLVLVEKFSPRPWKREHNRLTWTPGVSLSGYPADYFFSLEEIEELTAAYPEDHYWVFGQNNVEVFIYKVKE